MGFWMWIALALILAFQTLPAFFTPLFRYGFGRRNYTFRANLFLPLFVLAGAIGVRLLLPRSITYAPVRLLPPFNADPANQTLWASPEPGLLRADLICFLGFAAIVLLISLGHHIHLWIGRWRGTDPGNTRFWGRSWLVHVPVVGRLGPRILRTAVEPGIVLVSGYAFSAVAPAFGAFLIAGAAVLLIDQALVWRDIAEDELDARDALVQADSVRIRNEQAKTALVSRQQRGRAVSAKTLARVQKTPHALLALSPEETAAVRDQLGSERFGELVDQLEPSAQQAVYGRMVGLTSVPEAQSA